MEYGSAGDVFDVEEYDEIYASYVDARAKMNAMRQSRGFFPVVAIVDRGTSNSPTRKKGQKGQGKSKKGRGSGKSDGGGKQGPISPKGQRRGQAAIGRQICLRCGQPGHWARPCPSSPDKKRKLESEDAVLMVTEVYAMDELDGQEDEPLSTAVQDGGAASVLGSRHRVRRYLHHLMSLGYDLDTVETFRCRKGFRYGNSETEVTDMCLLLPIVVGGRRRKVLTYVVGGTAPLLFGRPLLRRLGLTVDYGKNQMRWPDGNWMPIPLGVKGEHQLELVEDKNLLLDAGQDEETLMPDDFATHIDVVNSMGVKAIMEEMAEMMVTDDASAGALCESGEPAKEDGWIEPDMSTTSRPSPEMSPHSASFPAESSDGGPDAHPNSDLQETTRVQFENEACPTFVHYEENDQFFGTDVKVKTLTKGKMHSLVHSAQVAAKTYKRHLEQASRIAGKGPKLIWEVFAGEGRTSKCASDLGARVETFSKKTGWNFETARDRRRLLRKLVEEEPDEVLVSPTCRLWSPLQEISLAAHPERRAKLMEARKEDHDTVLTFVAMIYEKQRRSGRHCHLEHPWTSRAWMTRAFNRLRGHRTYVDQCQYGRERPAFTVSSRSLRAS